MVILLLTTGTNLIFNSKNQKMEDFSPYLPVHQEPEVEMSHPPPRQVCIPNGIKMILRRNVTNFMGRTQEQKFLTAALKSEIVSHHINAAVTGAPGVGKTELTLRVVNEMRDDFDHILWINCGTEESMLRDLILIAALLDIHIDLNNSIEVQVLVHKIYNYCNSYKCLFIFDNITNHRYFQCNFLPPIGSNRSKIFILVTSFFKEWDTEKSIHLRSFTVEETKLFLTSNLKDITSDEILTIAKIMDQLPFGLQLAVSYIQHQIDLKYYDNDVYTIEDFINENFIENVMQFTLGTDEKVKYTKSFSSLYNDVIKYITLERQGSLALNLLPKLALVYPKFIPIGLFKLKKETNIDDLSINQALLVLEKYSMIDFKDHLINMSCFTQIIVRKKYSDTLTFHIELIVKMILDKTNTSDEGTPILDDPVYLSSLWSAWGIWQSLETRPELPMHMSIVPYIIANSSLGRSEEIISYFDSCDSVNLRELGWTNENYIGLKAAIIRHHYKLKQFDRVVELSDIAESHIADCLQNTKAVLEMLHYKASALQKLNRFNEAFTLAQDVLNRRIQYISHETSSYLKTLKRLCAIVTRIYQYDPKTLMLQLWMTIYGKTIYSDAKYLCEKVLLLQDLQKYFSILGATKLKTLYDSMEEYLISKGADSQLIKDNMMNHMDYNTKLARRLGEGIYTSSDDDSMIAGAAFSRQSNVESAGDHESNSNHEESDSSDSDSVASDNEEEEEEDSSDSNNEQEDRGDDGNEGENEDENRGDDQNRDGNEENGKENEQNNDESGDSDGENNQKGDENQGSEENHSENDQNGESGSGNIQNRDEIDDGNGENVGVSVENRGTNTDNEEIGPNLRESVDNGENGPNREIEEENKQENNIADSENETNDAKIENNSEESNSNIQAINDPGIQHIIIVENNPNVVANIDIVENENSSQENVQQNNIENNGMVVHEENNSTDSGTENGIVNENNDVENDHNYAEHYNVEVSQQNGPLVNGIGEESQSF